MNRRRAIRNTRAIAAGSFAAAAIGALINTLTGAPDAVMWWNALVLLCAALAYATTSVINRHLNRSEPTGPQIPLDAPVTRAENHARAARRGRGRDDDWDPREYRHHDHNHADQ